MNRLLKYNSGLKSRIAYNYKFPDLTTDELLLILKQKMIENRLLIDEKALKKLESIINAFKTNKDFGNGRFIDKLFEFIMIEHATNVLIKNNKNNLITEKDININEIYKHFKYKNINFGF